jgi:hypothetical protein
MQRETTEATNLDTLTTRQRFSHVINHQLHRQLNIFGTKLRLLRGY